VIWYYSSGYRTAVSRTDVEDSTIKLSVSFYKTYFYLSLACRCHKKAKEMGYKFFAIRFFGECVGGSDEGVLEETLKSGKGLSNACNNIHHDKCDNHNGGTECVGMANADYLYRVTQANENRMTF